MLALALQVLLIAAALGLAAAFLRRYRAELDAGALRLRILAMSAVANFFDTLGIGSFAPTTAILKAFRMTSDDRIPGTLIVGYALPSMFGAFLLLGLIEVSPSLLAACIVAAVLGATFGARIVAKAPVRAIRIGMGVALCVAGLFYAARNLDLFPPGGSALGLDGAAFVAAVAGHFAFGALMTIGVGFFAPSLILLTLLGMDTRAVFPIMMASSAFLMPAAGFSFIAAGRLDPKLCAAFALGGLPGVVVAAFVVKEIPLEALRWLVAFVVLVAGAMMLASAASDPARSGAARRG